MAKHFARALDQLVKKRGPSGAYKYTAKDVHALRSLLLLEVARRDEVDGLSNASKIELAMTLDLIGISAATPPEKVFPLVKEYYVNLDVNPAIFEDFNEMVELLRKGKDRVEAVEKTQRAYDKLTEREGPKAPKEDDPVPEDAENATELTLSLGGKVRI